MTARSIVVEVDRNLPGPAEVVWELLTEWEHQGDWMLEASDVVVTSEHRTGVGVEAEATVRIAGMKTRDKIRVTGWEPPKRLAIEHLGWVSGNGEIHLTPSIGVPTTHIDWREEFHPPLGLVGWTGMMLFKPLLLRTFRRDLRVLESLTRARAAISP